MQYVMKIFEDDEHDEFRVIDRDGDPWFVLNEVCAKVGIANPADAGSRLDDDEKDTIGISDSIGRTRRATIINESGLYSVILRSNKPEARRFRKWITSVVLPSIRKTGSYHGKVPTFIRRYSQNWDRVSAGNFSILGEMVVHLWGRFEMAGHIMADKAPDGTENRPDGSAGRLFSDWLTKNYPTVSNAFSYYIHWTPEWEGEVRQYPLSLLPLFREFLEADWIPNHAPRYFKTRDAAALPYLPKILPSVEKAKPGMMRKPSTPRLVSGRRG